MAISWPGHPDRYGTFGRGRVQIHRINIDEGAFDIDEAAFDMHGGLTPQLPLEIGRADVEASLRFEEGHAHPHGEVGGRGVVPVVLAGRVMRQCLQLNPSLDDPSYSERPRFVDGQLRGTIFQHAFQPLEIYVEEHRGHASGKAWRLTVASAGDEGGERIHIAMDRPEVGLVRGGREAGDMSANRPVWGVVCDQLRTVGISHAYGRYRPGMRWVVPAASSGAAQFALDFQRVQFVGCKPYRDRFEVGRVRGRLSVVFPHDDPSRRIWIAGDFEGPIRADTCAESPGD